jgi:hypothetical protein
MKTVRLSLVVGLAALGLQACDVSVKPEAASTPAPEAAQQAPQPAAPVDATPTPTQSTEAPAPATPETAAMGAQPAAPAVPDGVAAPTELAQFFEQNPIKPKAQ